MIRPHQKHKIHPVSAFIACGMVALLFSQLACADGIPFSIGDIFAGTGSGTILHFDKNFKLEDTLSTTFSGEQTGMAFDKTMNLYATNFGGGKISKFSSGGKLTLPNPFVTNDPGSDNESIVFDKAGNFYVGQADGTHDIIKRSATGAFIARYHGITDRGTDWIELAGDQKTIFYDGEGKTVRRIDTSTGKQLADFATLPGPNAFALRFLPNGNLLVADGDRVVQLNTSGTVVKTYVTPPGGEIFALNLEPGGATFLTANISTGHIYRFDTASGKLLMDFATGSGEVAGLAVAGESTVAAGGGGGGGGAAAPAVVPLVLPPIHFILVDQAAIFSAEASALPVALSQRENLLSVNRTVTSDVNARLFRLRSRSEEIESAAAPAAQSGKEITEPGKEVTGTEGKGSKEIVEPAKILRLELFAAGDFDFQDLDHIGSTAGFDFDSQSATAGLEYRLTKQLAFGLAGSYVDSHAHLTNDLGKTDISGYALSSYVSWFWHNFYADALYAFSDLEDNLARHTLLGRTAYASPHSRNHSVNFNTGYNLKLGSVLTGPIGALEYVNGHLDGYTERAGDSGAIHADGQNYDSLISRLGWQISVPIPTGWGSITPQVRASWDRQNLDASEQVSVSLKQSPITIINGSQVSEGGKFTATGKTAPPGRDYLNLGGGVMVNLGERGQIVLDYEAHIAQTNNTEQLASIKVGWKF